jgi:hypothetical protein
MKNERGPPLGNRGRWRHGPCPRQTFAARLAEDGAAETQALLGHESLNTSRGYIVAVAGGRYAAGVTLIRQPGRQWTVRRLRLGKLRHPVGTLADDRKLLLVRYRQVRHQ